MTQEEVKEYLLKYCELNVREEDCTLENVLGLIPNVDGEQNIIFSHHTPLIEHCFDELMYAKPLRGELTLMRNDDGVWCCDWDLDGVVGTMPQSKSLMEAALYMCELCSVNGIPLFNSNMQFVE